MFNQLKIIGYVLLSFQLLLEYPFWNGNTVFSQEYKFQLDRPEYKNFQSDCQVSYRAIRVGKTISPSQSANVPQTYKAGSETKFEVELHGYSQSERSPDSNLKSIRITKFHANDALIAEGFNLELRNQTLLIQEKNGKKTFRVNGTKVEGFNLEFMELLFSVDWWGKEGTDKAYGTKQEQAIGDFWTIQPSVDSMKYILPSEVFNEKGINIKFNCTGKAELVAKITIAGRDYFQFKFSEKCPACLSGKTSDGLEIVGGVVDRTVTGILPVNPNFPWQKVNIKRGWSITRKITEPPLNGVKLQSSLFDDVTKEITFPEK